ncbi:MAG: molecular chaperone HtpG [Candidatus Hydrogenedentota bacterium]
MSVTAETFEFQTEARQLLDLMIHSVYSNKDIFLRELISNASDAIDKRKFEGVQHPEFMEGAPELTIFLEADADAHTLSIHDNGIGMNREEVQDLIGTIAKSGTKEFLEQLQENKEAAGPELIGQFGIGFYSAYMVADKVELVSRRADEETATRWESAGEGTYTLEEVEREQVGTTITLHLKPTDDEDGMQDYTQEWVLRSVVKKYSDFVSYPIQMNIEREEHEYDDEGKVIEGSEPKKVIELETLNSMKALWLKEKKDTTEEEINEFYKHISHDWNEPMDVIRAKIEGTLEYRLLLFIPSKAPMDMFYRDAQFGIHLYVKRVFIMDDCRELLPDYLRFVKGVVDSEDLSLNMSREILQQDRQVKKMSNGIVNKILDALKRIKNNDDDKYRSFWTEFGVAFKEGLYSDHENRDALLELLMCQSSADSEELTSLQAYVDRMTDEQESIYYLTGESRQAVENSPHLEAFKEKGYEVLYFTDPVDDIWLQSVFEYQEKNFQSVGKGEADLGTEEEKKKAEDSRKEKQETFGSLLEKIQQDLEEEVKEVRLSNRLTESAACLVQDEGDMTPQMEKLMAQMGQEVPKTKRILELNPDHPILEKLQSIFDNDQESAELTDYANLLHGQAILAEGGQIDDPGRFAKLVSNLMVQAL